MSYYDSIQVKSDVMRWIIDTSGCEIKDLSEKLNVSEIEIERWKTKNGRIRIQKIEQLSEYVKRPLALFMLERPPKEVTMTDYRTVSSKPVCKLTKKTMIGIRNARYLQSIAKELMDSQGISTVPQIRTDVSIRMSPDKVSKMERVQLGLESHGTLSYSNQPSEFYNLLRQNIESLNILVFQTSAATVEELRGLTLSDRFPRVILINSKDTIEARIFSLLHEYGHVLLRKDGICTPELTSVRSSDDNLQSVEWWCNNFAASALMPKKEFVAEYRRLEEEEDTKMDLNKIILRLASTFKASKQSTAIRIKSLNLRGDVSYPYLNISQEIKNKPDSVTKKMKPSGGPPPANLCISQKGKKFVSLVLKSKINNTINNSDVIDYLGIDLKHMEKLQMRLS